MDPWGFDTERQALARRLRAKRLALRAVHGATFATIAGGLVFRGAAALRDLVISLHEAVWVSVVMYLALLFAIFALAELPFSYAGGFLWERAFGLSTQTVSGWAKDLAKSLTLGLGSTVVVGGALLWLLATTPWWWLVAWLLGLAVSAALGFLVPILLVPLFFRFRPIEDAGLRARFQALAERAHVPILGVFELQASAKTRRSNAAVMGLGRTRRVVVTDTLLADFPPEEIETVLAHELAHQRFLDPIRGFLLGSATSLVIFSLVAWIYPATYSHFGISSMGDVAGLPWLGVLFSLAALPFRPFELRWSRQREARTDRFSLELTANPSAFAAAMVRLHDRNLGVADPRAWEKWLFYSHPSGRERVDAARAFAVARV